MSLTYLYREKKRKRIITIDEEREEEKEVKDFQVTSRVGLPLMTPVEVSRL